MTMTKHDEKRVGMMHMELQPDRKPTLKRAARVAPLAFFVVAIFLTLIGAAQGASTIEYFVAWPSSFMVLLEWSTTSEYNVAGFDIYCKLAAEPASAYHKIGNVAAKGGIAQPAQYSFPVTRLDPGAAYCFQLREVTTDDEPGERRELCGYGLNITPTPPSPFSLTPDLGATATGGFDPFSQPFTPTFPQPESFPPTPTPTPLGAAPDQQPPAAAASNSTEMTTSPNPDLAQSQTVDGVIDSASTTSGPGVPAPVSMLEPSPTVLMLDLVTATPLGDLTVAEATPTPAVIPVDEAARADEALAGAAGNEPQGPPTATPTSLYIVVTAAPTLAPLALPALLTPWPTVTPVPGGQLGSLFVPTTQNLTVMLLCFIFLSASTLGALGLITSVLYMRSRSQRELMEMQRRQRNR